MGQPNPKEMTAMQCTSGGTALAVSSTGILAAEGLTKVRPFLSPCSQKSSSSRYGVTGACPNKLVGGGPSSPMLEDQSQKAEKIPQEPLPPSLPNLLPPFLRWCICNKNSHAVSSWVDLLPNEWVHRGN